MPNPESPIPEEYMQPPKEQADSAPSDLQIPESELSIEFVRSSGKGGQNVNKRSTKAQVRWNLERSSALSDEQKTLAREALSNRLTLEGDLLVASQSQRSQGQNKEEAIRKLRELVKDALMRPEERIESAPTRSAKEKRLGEKALQKSKKEARKFTPDDY